jgi:diaminopimelate epimerase
MKHFLFTKMSGAGNDFILFDKKINPEIELNAEIISKICQRGTGIGADGVLLIEDAKDSQYTVKYFNSDGTTGSLCANGSRCAIKYAKISGRVSNQQFEVVVNGQNYRGQVLESDLVKFHLNSPKDLKRNFKIKAGSQLINASYVNTGSPHTVIKINDVLSDIKKQNSFYKDLNDFPVYNLGREIRYSSDFAPEGTNVNFIDIVNGTINIRTYERGVEDETLACGTGAVASAIVSCFNDGLVPPIKLVPKSGDELFVDFKCSTENISDLALIGPAVVVFKGELSI